MNISAIETEIPKTENVKVTDNTLSVDLSDGRTISAPLEWFPRLVHATVECIACKLYVPGSEFRN